MTRRTSHILIALAVGLAAGLLVYRWQVLTGTSDLYQRLCAARGLLDGIDPYTACQVIYRGHPAAEYPMTTILAFVPVARLPYEMGAALFWAVSNALLVYGLLKRGRGHHWLIFLTGQYWLAFAWGQFSVLITAVLLLPSLMPLALLKPQLGLPVFLLRPSWRRAAACAVFVAATFIVFPRWPWSWWSVSSRYDGIIPLLALPLGPLVLLAALRWRDPSARFLLLYACTPQRWFYDLTPLYMLPRTSRQMLAACILSWAPAVGWLTQTANGYEAETMLLCVYLPMLSMLLIPSFAPPARTSGRWTAHTQPSRPPP